MESSIVANEATLGQDKDYAYLVSCVPSFYPIGFGGMNNLVCYNQMDSNTTKFEQLQREMNNY